MAHDENLRAQRKSVAAVDKQKKQEMILPPPEVIVATDQELNDMTDDPARATISES